MKKKKKLASKKPAKKVKAKAKVDQGEWSDPAQALLAINKTLTQGFQDLISVLDDIEGALRERRILADERESDEEDDEDEAEAESKGDEA